MWFALTIDSGEPMVKCSKSQRRKLKTALRWKIPAAQRQRIQMVLLRESGMTQPAIAATMGVSLSTVNRAHMAYDDGGIKALKPKPIGGRQRENMTLAGEKALLACFAKAAGAGEMLNIHDLMAAYEQAIGHPTSNSTICNLLVRHGCESRAIAGPPTPRHRAFFDIGIDTPRVATVDPVGVGIAVAHVRVGSALCFLGLMQRYRRVLLQAALLIFPSAAARARIVTPDLAVSRHRMSVPWDTIRIMLG